MQIKKRAATVALLTAATVVLAGCASGSTTQDSGDAAACAPSDGKVDLTFTTWIPGIEDVVKIWNEDNPDVQVKVQTGPNGNGGTYQNFFNQLKAGNAPDLGQIEYDALPNFRVQDGLTNLASCEGVLDAQDNFVDWTWGQVNFGEADAVYAVPQDAGPMAMFYRADLFAANNIAIPTTWEEFAVAAEAVRATGGYITNFSQSDINQFAGFVWQAGGSWFENDGDNWTIDLTSPESVKVADYWQDLIDRDLVSTNPPWTDEWNNAYNTGSNWTWNSAAWGANSIASGAPDTAGNWSVALSPQWASGDNAAGNWGGSSTAVFKGSKHPYEAAQFALWLNTSDEALTMLNESANLYPAAKSGLELPALKEGVEFYGGQPIYDVFAEASAQVSPDFVWGPTMTQVYNDTSDGFKGAVTGNGTLTEALTSAQQSTINALEAQSIPVNK
ncbi:extracellular solute-binding protein [Cryobacterium levicorallinum]|uniref:Extracellular solute-binding protein n=1 Tax=Cryobacterium levicorallinum TaxID=995038 RepID=A0A1I3AG73_9MICO|nr:MULTISPECIES: extracellular solute-binding protein [Cryobacterium]TFB86566.1 extracellular solute-binding protein [Cryobacterium levicorallinum]GEP26589.1 sugar ABC transporter substrate-binding protein [Cryobacterium levicorallinum]SFH48995.1 multiple sugar transport system substrate-binding protein [Cryobacterium levicorallinum]